MHSTVIAAHAVCRPVLERVVRGVPVREAVTLPNRVAQLYLNLNGKRGLQTLQGVCAAPLLSHNGSIHCRSGFDPDTGLWCVGVDLPPICKRPTLKNAHEALELIRSSSQHFRSPMPFT